MSVDQGLLDRLPPQNQEAERCVLGAMLRDNRTIDDVVQIVRKEDFYTDGHQKIYETIVALNDKGGQPVDVVILYEALVQREWIADVGGAIALRELWDAVPSAANVEYYAKIVREKAVLRNLILTSNEILTESYKQTMPADQLVETAQRKLFDLAEKGMTSHLTTLADAIKETYDQIDKRTAQGDIGIGGISTGFTDLNELTAGLHDRELIIIAARPSVGKCLSAQSEIVLADGSVVTIEEIYRRKQARLLTLGDDWRLGWAEPSAFVDDGEKPVFRVTTRLGRQVEATASHPFLTVNGWRPLGELSAGERIAVPRVVPVFGTAPMRDCEAKLLGYLLGDGGLTDTTPEFSNSNPRVRDDFIAAVREFGPLHVRGENLDGPRTPTLLVSADPDEAVIDRLAFAAKVRPLAAARFPTLRAFAEAVGVSEDLPWHWWKGSCAPSERVLARIASVLGCSVRELAPRGWAVLAGKNTLTSWLRDLGLWGKGSRDKFVPGVVFRLCREQAALFLNRLFATDGWATLLTAGNTQIGYASVSERLIRQVQHLLLRFGIISSLRRREVKYRDTRRPAWQLDVTDQRAIRTFAFKIGMFGKEEALERVAEAAGKKRYQTNRDLIPMGVWEHLDQRRGEESWSSLAQSFR